jgi:myo-inositol 2-dehydrogenase / D-chiro-inositol 1-dehydrogenase
VPVRVGILGAGHMGRTHAEVLGRDDRVRVVGVADPEADRAGRLAGDLHVPHHSDLEGLFQAGLDLLVVTTPNRFHCEASLAALARGVGVLSEKPMAIHFEDARRLCEAAERPGAFYVVAHNRRHAPVYVRVRGLLREGFRPLLASFKMHEGDYRTPPWVSDRSVSGGFLYENLVHFFDLMEWLVAPIAEVSCLARGPLYPDLNDFVISVAFEGGAIGALTATGHASWLRPAERTELVGDHATIVVEELDRVLRSQGGGEKVGIDDFAHLSREERWGYVAQDREIVEAFLARRAPCFSARRALRSLEIADACSRAALEGRAVRPGPPPSD